MEKIRLGEAERADTIGTECTADDAVNFKRMISELAEGNGDIENMGYAFFWSKTPQGHAYWESKLDKPEFTVEDKVYLRFLAGEYDELEFVPYRGSAAEWVSYSVTVDRAPWNLAEALRPASFQAVDVSTLGSNGGRADG